MPKCSGNSSEHCCWVAGEPCKYLGENLVEGRHWCCTLFIQYGDWPLVHASTEYQEIKNQLVQSNIMTDCGDWPPTGLKCESCGITG